MGYALLYRVGRLLAKPCSHRLAGPPSPRISSRSPVPPYVFLFCMLFFPNPAKVFVNHASIASELHLGCSIGYSYAQIRACAASQFFHHMFVNTPLQRNLIPPFINPRITSSPSWLIIVICFISITSSRPRRSALALSQVLFSSAAHGAMSFPSTTNRRCLELSISEIFSIASSNPQ